MILLNPNFLYMQALLHMMQCTGSGPITGSYIDVGSGQWAVGSLYATHTH